MEVSGSIPPTPKTKEELKQLEETLPKELWFNSYPMYLYQGFWNIILESTIACQNHFQAQDNDIFISSIPKTGTTWLKALIFSLINRENHSPSSQSHPLLQHNPHGLIPQLESIIYADPKKPDLRLMETTTASVDSADGCPRLMGTHLPYQSLPESMKSSNCKIVYICRNPLDTFISSWLFYLNYDENKSVKGDMIEDYFGKFCEGKFPFGPFEDHALGYWKESLERPKKVLFVRFEDLKVDFEGELKRLARFLGCPLSQEEGGRVVDEIKKLCSIDRLKEVEANKSGRVYSFIENKWFFRKGEVGDWVNYLNPSMVERFEMIMEEKFRGFGLKL